MKFNFFDNNVLDLFTGNCVLLIYGLSNLKKIYKMLLTRKVLKSWQVTYDVKCKSCAEDVEDVMRSFWYCPVVAHFG